MTASEIRTSFLRYFERQGHRIVSSSGLVPANDPTLLFTNAGMNQFKEALLGRESRGYVRATTAQKCMRVSGKHNDLDNVGPSVRHHTFFEMLGNFSFGDYFKKEAITYAWELLTGEWRLRPERLFGTFFAGEANIPRDTVAEEIWARFLPRDRVYAFGLDENFWAMGETGPCGPCGEIHYFRGNDLPCDEERQGSRCRGLLCSCDRFVEIWNLVFMQYDRQPDGSFVELPAPSIDTGMGMERIAAVLQGVVSDYDTDLFRPILDDLAERAGIEYGAATASDISMRVVADHVRAMTFLIADGVVPSNEWRGYVLRKIMRRAMRHGQRLGIGEAFLHELAGTVIGVMAPAYPELAEVRAYVGQSIKAEEERFDAVLTGGLARLEEVLDRTAASASREVPGQDAFKLYDTYGLPVDFIEDLAGERGLGLDRSGFDREMEEQRARARASSKFTGAVPSEVIDLGLKLRDLGVLDTEFVGYGRTTAHGCRIVAALREWDPVNELHEDESGQIILDRTPFYVESGGQVSDRGRIFSETGSGSAEVTDMQRLPGHKGVSVHAVRMTSGLLRRGDIVTAEVPAEIRAATMRNHTATHLLHAALRTVLGTHVKQAGSLVAPDRLRFDFVHHAPMRAGERDRVEERVNQQIYRNTPVVTEVKGLDEAIAAGAMALFGEKYSEQVRVVSVAGFSMELCGGTHVGATGDIGFFLITQESGIAAGVRRIEALTGAGAMREYQGLRDRMAEVTDLLRVPREAAAHAVARLQQEHKRLAREVEQLKVQVAMGGPARIAADDIVTLNGVKLLTRRVTDLEKAALRDLADSLKADLKSGVVVLASVTDEKVSVVVSVTPDLTARLNAGEIVRAIAPVVGGGGGGRADFAEAGGRSPEQIDELFAESRRVVEALLRG